MNPEKCAQWIKKSTNIVALTGAGISTSVGIPDFRGPQGIYVTKKYDPIKTFDVNYFYKDPGPFYDFTRDLLSLSKDTKPSFTHKFLKKLEDAGKLKAIITQNVDMLHQKAGNNKVYELHGSYLRSKCVNCGKTLSFEEFSRRIFKERILLCDECGGIIKPDIVFFGEPVKFMKESIAAVMNSDLLLIIGTSLKIYPANMLPHYANNIIIVNKGEVFVPADRVALRVQEDIDEFFKKVDNLLR